MISTSPSAATSGVTTVARAGKSAPKNARYSPFIAPNDALVYITDAASFGAMNGEYRAFFGGDFPARATVVTPLVAADGLVEIMVTAVVADPGASGSQG